MDNIIKKMLAIVIIIIFMIEFSDSYSALNLDDLTYVLAIGIDTSKENKLEVSFQFTPPVSAESSSTERPTPILNTVTASSVSNAINLVNSYLGKSINLSHCKAIIISEELAMQGISDEIYTLINDTQIRPSTNIIVSKCSAKYYLEQTKPEIENLIAKYYETFTSSSRYVGYMPDATIGDFFNALSCNTCEPYAILGGVNEGKPKNNNEPDSQTDYTIKANESSIQGENGAENIGVAVFKDDKLVGELNALETISLLNIRNELDIFLVSVPDPANKDKYLDVYLAPISSPTITVDTSSTTPYIKLKFKFSGSIYSMTETTKSMSRDSLDSISTTCDSYLENTFSEYLYRTSKDLKSDINSLGIYALKNFFTTKDFENYNWLANYKNAFFDVEVDTSIKSGMLLSET